MSSQDGYDGAKMLKLSMVDRRICLLQALAGISARGVLAFEK